MNQGKKAVSTELFRLTDATGIEVIINPTSVRYLAPGPQGTTRVCFDNAHSVSVRGSPREIQNRLAGGSGDMEVWSPARETLRLIDRGARQKEAGGPSRRQIMRQ